MAGLWGGQLADREGGSDECDHLCFGLESLIQPLTININTFDVKALLNLRKKGGGVLQRERCRTSMERGGGLLKKEVEDYYRKRWRITIERGGGLL